MHKGGGVPFALIAAHSYFEPKLLTYQLKKQHKTQNNSLKFLP